MYESDYNNNNNEKKLSLIRTFYALAKLIH